MTEREEMSGLIEVVQNDDGTWTWTLLGEDGQVVARSTTSSATYSEARFAGLATTRDLLLASRSGGEPDFSKALFVLAGGLVVGVLGAVGVSGDLLTRLVRNHAWQVVVPLLVILVAGGLAANSFARAAQHTERAKNGVSALIFAVVSCLALVAIFGARSQSERELPSVELGVVRSDGGGRAISATASGTGLRSSEKLLLQVVHVAPPGRDLAELRSICRDARDRLDNEISRKTTSDVRLLVWQEVGPAADGSASATADLPIDAGEGYYCALAQLQSRQGEISAGWAVLAMPPCAILTSPLASTDPPAESDGGAANVSCDIESAPP